MPTTATEAKTNAPEGFRPLDDSGVPRIWQHVLLACGCALALTLLVSSYLQSSLGLEALDEVLTQSAQVDHMDQLQLLLVNSETGVRGYLLTGEPVYLEPYEAAIPEIDTLVERIRADFSDKPTMLDELEALLGLVRAKQEVMGEAVARRTLEGEQDNDLAGKILMDEARQQIGALRANLLSDVTQSIIGSKERFKLTRGIGIALAGGTLLLLLALFAVMQRQAELRNRLTDLLATENSRLDRQVRQRTAELRRLARYLTNAREAEQARLARELHDELGSLLTAAKLDTGWIRRKLPDDLREAWKSRLDRLQETLTSGIALKRRIIDDLRPPLLKDLGLVEALRALAEDFAMGNEITVDIVLPDDASAFDEERSLTLFRIAQEAFTNIRKYANARNVTLSLVIANDQARLEVTDDGVGFNPQGLASDRHGLAGMLHRVQTYAGRFSVESSPGNGARIVAEVPLNT
ncbi:MAG: CHASE3 domain-containing protein [Rhodocyclaceae bacterium]|nr:CHASE3 domain-containing protein [Rhodocyclaceae bacterium]